MHYLTDRFHPAERRLIWIAALVLLPVFFVPVLPIWQMKLWAPQYREGLTLTIYTNTIRGDLQSINTLNHYVGMKHITADDFREFRYLPQALTLFGFLALIGALVNRRWVAFLGWLLFTGFAGYMFADYARWLYDYGHQLDPRAPIKLPLFTPPLIGWRQMANFKVLSIPMPGTLLLGLAWLLGPAAIVLEMRDQRRAAKAAALRAIATGCLLALLPGHALAAVSAAPGEAARAIAAAVTGDTVVLASGIHRGPLTIDRPLTLAGAPGAVLDGGGRGTVLDVAAAGTVVRNLAIRGSGSRVITVDAAVRVRAEGVRLERIAIVDALYGINAERATGLAIEDCRLTGRVAPGDESGSGNGIHLWYTRDAVVRRDTVDRFLDGIYLSFTERTHIESSVLEQNGRYGLHTMYCPSGRLVGNQMTRNVAGCAIMFSNHLEIERNEFSHNRGGRTYGLLLRDCSDGVFADNRLVDNTVAVFMDGSNRNLLRDNLVQDCGWGILLFSSCEGNTFTGNAFLNDDYPVALDMRFTRNAFDDGRAGNFWSDNAPYDLNDDGVSDVPYTPVSTFAFVSKQYPDLAILARSPAVAALSVAERVIPSLRPSEAVDRFPRVRAGRGAAVRGPGHHGERPRRAWGAAAAFAALSAGGALGLMGARRA